MLARLALLSALFLTACGDGESAQRPLAVLEEGKPTGECSAISRRYEGATASHLRECSDIGYATSPPVFGDHYPVWAAYKTYDFPVPLGYLVHNLEHGAVVLFYDCPEGCGEEVAEAQAFIDALPADPRCGPDVRVQVVLVPRPGLGSRWAASAWGYSLNAECFDPEVFGQFYAAHSGHGPEDLCTQGVALASDPCR